MGTNIRPEISTNKKYWIERHRYYELKHFCLQYPIWKKAYFALDGLSKKPDDLAGFIKASDHSDPTAKCAEEKLFYIKRMEMVEQTAIATDPELHNYILKGVTEGLTYENLKTKMNIPCCRDSYYDLYRKFFYLLNKARE